MNRIELKKQKKTKNINTLKEVLQREAICSRTRFTLVTHGLTDIRKDVRDIEDMLSSRRYKGDKILCRCNGTLIHDAFNKTPKGEI